MITDYQFIVPLIIILMLIMEFPRVLLVITYELEPTKNRNELDKQYSTFNADLVFNYNLILKKN